MIYMAFWMAHGASRNRNAAPQHADRRTRRSGRTYFGPWTVLLLVLTSLLSMIGCAEDDDRVRVDLTDVQIAETSSVLSILASKALEFTEHEGGFLFGVQNGEIEFGEVTKPADGVPQVPFVVRDFDRLNEELNFEEGEGDIDSEAACRFSITQSAIPNMAVDSVTTCDSCAIVINALGIPLGGSGRGELAWHLARCSDAGDTSPFTSVPVEVTVAVDDAGNLIAVDGIPIQAEATP